MSPQIASAATATATAITITIAIASDQAASTKAHRAAAPSTALREFLAFRLGAAEYGIDLQRVHEIRAYEEPTRIAAAPPGIKGVVKLRGVIVPIVDLRLKLNLASARCDSLTAIIVLDIGSRVVGIVVDAGSDVITLTPEQLVPASEISSAIERDHLLAIGVTHDRMLILVDIEKMLSGPDIGLVEPMLQ